MGHWRGVLLRSILKRAEHLYILQHVFDSVCFMYCTDDVIVTTILTGFVFHHVCSCLFQF